MADGVVLFLNVSDRQTLFFSFVLISLFQSGVRACSYPGTAISGRMSSVKFYYAIGESVTFSCDNGLEIKGPKMLKCMKDGKWSSSIPICVTPESDHARASRSF